MRYRPTFDADAVFYFSEHLGGQEIVDGLNSHLERLKESLEHIREHHTHTLSNVPDEMEPWAQIIFDHHIAHHQAEIAWAESSIRAIRHVERSDREV